METRWLYTNSYDFPALREASEGVCIIPMGCIEKHSVHLPLGTDILKASRLCHLASQIETAAVFPDFTFGDTPFGAHAQRPEGTICLDVRTQLMLLEELCDEIAANGFNKILVVSAHGGNARWLDVFARNINTRPHDYVWGYFRPSDLMAPHTMAKIILEKGSGAIPELTLEDEELIIKYHKMEMRCGHACMGETTYMMGVTPENVHLDRLGMENGLPQPDPCQKLEDAGIITESHGWFRRFPNWYEGHDPVGTNERLGAAALRLESERIARAIKAFKEDTWMWEHHCSVQL